MAMGFWVVVWKMRPYWWILGLVAPLNQRRKIGPALKFDTESNGDLGALVQSRCLDAMVVCIGFLVGGAEQVGLNPYIDLVSFICYIYVCSLY